MFNSEFLVFNGGMELRIDGVSERSDIEAFNQGLVTVDAASVSGVPLLFVTIDGLLSASVTPFSQHFTPADLRLNPVPILENLERFVLSLTLENKKADMIYAWRTISLSPACSRNLADILEQDLLTPWVGYRAFEQTYRKLTAGSSASALAKNHARAPSVAGQA